MTGVTRRFILSFATAWLGLSCLIHATDTPPPAADAPVQLIISVPDQRLVVVKDGEWLARYPVSTSRFGTGDNFGSFRTPLGQLKICDKIGDNLSPGSVIRHRSATGEVLPVNAPGRDPIVTRVIWLDGMEAQNQNAHARGIYIHGTPEERTLGTPVSWGCIRMRSKDVIQVFNEVPVGTVVSIIPAKIPHMHRWEPPKVQPEPVVTPSADLLAKASAQREPGNKQPEAKSDAGKLADQKLASTKPGGAAKPTTDKLADDKSAKPKDSHEADTASLPPVAEAPEHGNNSALREMKGSILLANLPGLEKQHNAKTPQ